MARLHQLLQIAEENYADYNVARVMKAVDDFLEVLSNWYIRRSRRRFSKASDDSDKWGAYQVLYEALKGLILVLAPVVPFITETIYQNLVRGLEPAAPESIHLCEFPQARPELIETNLMHRIDTLIRIVSVGRAARNKVNIKVRQPLRNLLVKLPADTLPEALTDLQTQLLEELNLKNVEFVSDETQFIRYEIKPNLALLGRRFGARIGVLQEALKHLSPETVSRFIQQGEIELSLANEVVVLNKDDLILERQEKAGLAVVTDNDITVALDTTITPELRREGLVRDFIRHVQTLRKEADFRVEDRIRITYTAPDDLREAVTTHLEYFKNETLAVAVEPEYAAGEYSGEVSIDGNKIRVSLSRIK